jgi:hypothetical protein
MSFDFRHRRANHCPFKAMQRRIGPCLLNASRKPFRNFLEQPAVAVRILE